ncbi:futalosine hydrolase [Pedobacter sp. HMWF019]|uniref:futalosine hydrolase n=1 Tax=Pedobacter sp. HMWF019 TaxID=2056856 RepID=UPI000D377427|nr:futalosine hydrolase [Pedobacter sp. HMWF019]PTS91953.1 futalosine hydrolase [Pedobacter sp. HMWF019]
MKILVVAATLPEISPVYSHFGIPHEQFYSTPGFDLLITGVGMTATAYALGKQLATPYRLVLNLGIAGSFDYSIPLGSVVSITSDTFSELGAEDKNEFLPIDQLGFGKSCYSIDDLSLVPHIQNLRTVRGITVNTVHGNTESIQSVLTRLQPITESMEGAAVFYSCEQVAVPCLQVRSISNYVEERNKENWKIGLAIKNLNDWAIDFLTNS